MRQIITAQRKLWEYGQRAFHDSIGSSNLLQDFRKWEDRLYINEFLKTTNVYNPRGLSFASGSTIDLSKNDFNGRPPRFNVIDDLEQIVADLTACNAPTFEDGNYACICSPYFLKDLRSDPKFMEVSRYPGQVSKTDMMAPAMAMQPPQIPFANSVWMNGLMGGQARSVGMQEMMPTGFVFDGVRFFVSNNLPKASAPNVTYTNATNTALNAAATRSAEIGIFFGPEAVGLGIGGPGPEIRLNANDDFQRFVIAAWFMYGAWELLDERFVTVARSYTN